MTDSEKEKGTGSSKDGSGSFNLLDGAETSGLVGAKKSGESAVKQTTLVQKKSKRKQELNSGWGLLVLLLLSVGLLFVLSAQKQKSKKGIKGLRTNSDRLVDDAPATPGLQKNDRQSGSKERDGKKVGQAKGESEEGTTGNAAPSGRDFGSLDKKQLTEKDLNRLGWQALQANQPEAALGLFQAVLERKSDHLHSNAGLGKAYEALGLKEEAGKQYCQTAELQALSDQEREYWINTAGQIGTSCL